MTGQRQFARADIEFALDLLNRGEPAETVRHKLVERGMPAEDAAELLDELFIQSVYAEAVTLLNKGHSPDEVKRILGGMGLELPVASAIVDEIVAQPRPAAPVRPKLRNRLIGSLVGAIVCGMIGYALTQATPYWIIVSGAMLPVFLLMGLLLLCQNSRPQRIQIPNDAECSPDEAIYLLLAPVSLVANFFFHDEIVFSIGLAMLPTYAAIAHVICGAILGLVVDRIW